MSDKYHNVIGIDLGTTYSAVAANNKYVDSTEVFRTSKGERTIPSVVSFDRTNKKAYAGQDAKTNYPVDPDNTVIEIKREMGEVVNEQNIGKLRKLGLNPVINEDPYRVFFGDDWYLPQEISAFILMEAKEVAQKELNEIINDAVITVPAYFTEKQKKATEEAALLAGLYPRQLIPEPTAAAICYGVDTKPVSKMKYLVYDLGGGTFDVSIIEVENTLISVIATSGDRRLGGSDFDNEITNWVLKKLSADYQLDISNNQFFTAKIKAAAEEAKKILSQFDDASIDLSFINDQRINNIKITKSDFERLIDHLLHKSLNKVDEAIQVANMSKDDIDFILLVGGSTKIPKVKRLLLEYFGKGDDFVSADADPDTAVARGAAIMAKKFEATPGTFDIGKRAQANLMSKDSEGIPDTTLITEHSLGVGTVRDLVVHIIERGRVLPAKESKDDFVNSGPSEYIYVPVFQGESKYAYENTLIGTLPIGPMEPKPAGEHRFEVIFKIDQNGLLAMTINHLNENKSYNAEFIQKTGIGGDEKLKIVRMKLIDMYRHKEDGRFVPSAFSGSHITDVTYPAEPYDNVIPPPVSDGSKVSGIGSDIETVPFEEVIPVTKEPEKQEVTEIDRVSEAGILQPDKPVPAEFHEVVSQASNMYKILPDKELADLCNKFILLLNQGSGEEILEAAGDDLADRIDKLNLLYDNGLLIAKVQIPDQFADLISKCRESWIITKDRNLQVAFNEFISAVNKGCSEEELIDQGDTLAEVYDMIVRAGESGKDRLIEPAVEVPDKYKMLTRRAKKQLLLNPAPDLLNAFNSFIKGLNNNLGETEIGKLNEQLSKAFLETK
jgi:molecular chaperone DnaK (HSP70)